MKIQNTTQVVDRPLVDIGGRRIGTVVALHCAPDPYTAAWALVRLPGLRRQLRGVPMSGARWATRDAIAVDVPRERVVAAEPASVQAWYDEEWLGRMAAFYRQA